MTVLVAIGSVKGAPGVTTLGLGLVAVWPTRAVLVESDPAGGDLWARFGHRPEPGLATFAANARRPAQVPLLPVVAQRLAVGADVVLAPPGQAAAASVRMLAEHGIPAVRQAAATGTVVVDVGRLDPASPSFGLAAAAQHVLVVAGAGLDGQAQVAARLPDLTEALPGRVWLAVTGTRSARADPPGTPLIGVVPHSRWGAAALAGSVSIGNWRRLAMGQAITAIAARLAAQDTTPPPSWPPPPAQLTTPGTEQGRPR